MVVFPSRLPSRGLSWLRGRPILCMWILLFGLLLPTAGAEAQLRVTPHPESRFWIHGDATVRNFTCLITRVEGRARLPKVQDSLASGGDGDQTKLVVRVPLQAVDCGNTRMTNDLQETLKMKQHPEIRFELVHATMGARTDTSAQWRRVDAVGPLTVAGTKRLIRVHAAARAFDDEHFRLRGCLPIRMTYFGVEPPTKAFGLIRVKNRVEVKFDLLAQTKSADQSAHFDTISLSNPPSCHD